VLLADPCRSVPDLVEAQDDEVAVVSEAEERDGGAQVASVLGAMGLDYVDLARCL
jgi:hypothetical protein